jgi:hypothetical protein
MAMLDTNWNPSARQLRQFAGICAAALPLVAWFWSAGEVYLIGIGVGGASIALLGFLRPRLVLPFYLLLVAIAAPIGWLVGEVVLLSMYLTILTPIGFMFRLLGRDRLQLKHAPPSASFWQVRSAPRSVASYYHQFASRDIAGRPRESHPHRVRDERSPEK